MRLDVHPTRSGHAAAPVKILVVGTGLIGTSVGLALAGSDDVLLTDLSAAHLEKAVARGAGRRWDGTEAADLALVCAPPAVTASVITSLVVRGVAPTVSHVASHQSRVQAEVEASVGRVDTLCGGHPLAGRERGGPDAATARLFVDRPWVVCPSAATSSEARQAVVGLAEACGAVPVVASPEDHDAAVALVSHLPQVAASAVAAQLSRAAEGGDLDPLRLAGPGVQDTTRIAASDPELWVDVLSRNAAHVAPLVRDLSRDLARLADALDVLAVGGQDVEAAAADVRSLLERGQAGRTRLPLKQGRGPAVTEVVVAVSDRPGQLAEVLVAAAAAGVNVEDVRVEHLPGRPRGLVELLVPEAAAGQLRAALTAAGWGVLAGD